jgi:hypothetical protein
MNKEWLITLIFFFLGAVFISSSIDFNYFNLIPELVKKLIEPITQGILP